MSRSRKTLREMQEVDGRLLACVSRGDPMRVRLARGKVSELAMVEFVLHVPVSTQQQSLRDEVLRCPADK